MKSNKNEIYTSPKLTKGERLSILFIVQLSLLALFFYDDINPLFILLIPALFLISSFFETSITILPEKIVVNKNVFQKDEIIPIKNICCLSIKKSLAISFRFKIIYLDTNQKKKETAFVVNNRYDLSKIVKFFESKGVKIDDDVYKYLTQF